MDKAPQIYRAASKGKPFTRQEKINIITNRKIQEQRSAVIREMIATEKKEIEKERAARGFASRIRKAALDHPTLKIKRKRDGGAYFQERANGKMLPATYIS